MRSIDTIVVHHSASPSSWTVERIRKLHTSPATNDPSKPWSDIGYHWVLEADHLKVRPGRPEVRPGAHCKGHNASSIGICVTGDYTLGPVSEDVWRVLVEAVLAIMRRYELTPDRVFGHGELSATACPGFDPAALRSDLWRRLQPPSTIHTITNQEPTMSNAVTALRVGSAVFAMFTTVLPVIVEAMKDGDISAQEAEDIALAVDIGDIAVRVKGVDIIGPAAQKRLVGAFGRIARRLVKALD